MLTEPCLDVKGDATYCSSAAGIVQMKRERTKHDWL